ncbi:hypothetical protein OKA04_13920 [Luteolibacter flavescens]|uniref:DUF2304 domain-containing protein n=1 Tax=Luteolibacter flavescens TaxID=1859460 RepID=A0ABT3FQH8_9BACT|nr:hypothetical protein [Luteolibacter flavescens]MCW1885833.1 hypothetical protein [Luteolibacter flavescens]
MGLTPIALLFTLFNLPILIAQWIGVLNLRRKREGASWILMLTGTIIGSLTPLLPILRLILSGLSVRIPNLGEWFIFLPAMVGILGSMLFFVGFAMHALRISRGNDRAAELEQLAAAMAQEIDRLKAERGTP